MIKHKEIPSNICINMQICYIIRIL